MTRHRLPLSGYADVPSTLDSAREVLAVLAERPGYLRGWLTRAVDDPDLLVLAHEWADVGSYRRALSSYEVKLCWPFLQTATDEASAFEVLVLRTPDAVDEQASARGVDADTVGLGQAAAPQVSRGDFGWGSRREVRRPRRRRAPSRRPPRSRPDRGRAGREHRRGRAGHGPCRRSRARDRRRAGRHHADRRRRRGRLAGLPVQGRTVVVVDDGVETGTAGRRAALPCARRGATAVVLAVPVCPRESEAQLRARYDDVIAVTKPLARRSLRWHYDTFA